MSVFRLVLCLAGLVAYLVVKLAIQSPPGGSGLHGFPTGHPAASPVPATQKVVPKPCCPQTKPDLELIRDDANYVKAK